MNVLEQRIGDAVKMVYRRMEAACASCGRDPSSVTLCFATKTRTMEEVMTAAKYSRDTPCVIGENIVQTALERVKDGVHQHAFDKHFIGHLQTNKINQVLTFADCIQTVDSARLAEKISQRLEPGRLLRVYVQVNTSREEQKSGCTRDECVPLVQYISEACKNLRVEGLMTIGVQSEVEDDVVACFRMLAELKTEIAALSLDNVNVKELSMGMSGDMELAIREGSTMVRVGTQIFGERNYAKKEPEDPTTSSS
ncbi:hypothetical protein DIPPA_27186 [Diplonema papillatum]|nr:hypothetical protein DIPPA_27186 [Diplonema papillatum]